MKLLLPLALALVGLGAGVGAGVALKPKPEAAAAAACPDGPAPATVAADAAHDGEPVEEAHAGAADPAADCAAQPVDAFAPAAPHAAKDAHAKPASALVALDKPFVVPVFKGEKVVAMVVASVAVEIDAESETAVEAAQPRLRDSFLAAMFRHANSGGFDGAFTTGRKMEDLRAALLAAAQEVFADHAVSDVLITEIARQDI